MQDIIVSSDWQTSCVLWASVASRTTRQLAERIVAIVIAARGVNKPMMIATQRTIIANAKAG